jgi:hypothetical protein
MPIIVRHREKLALIPPPQWAALIRGDRSGLGNLVSNLSPISKPLAWQSAASALRFGATEFHGKIRIPRI